MEDIILDLSELKGIITLMQKSDLTDLEIETQDLKLRLGRPGTINHLASTQQLPQSASPLPVQAEIVQPQAPIEKKEDGIYIFKSPMVGTFYRKPSPDDPTFVSIGDNVDNTTVLCIIEAMKVMNEIQSDQSGEIIEILVEDSVSVEYGQPLFKIRI